MGRKDTIQMTDKLTGVEKDSMARNKIVSDMDHNFFVEAGAGSGKTTMLVSRMVAMVESGIDISKICAITFTKAAAGEFYDRFQKLLIERSSPEYKWQDKGYAGQLPEPSEQTRKRCEVARQNIDLCFMGTIDSFCSMILSEHPSEAEIPSDASIISDDDVKNMYKQIYIKICEGVYGEELRKLAKSFGRFYWNAEEVFIQGMSYFMDNRNVHFNYESYNDNDVDKEFAEEKAVIKGMVRYLVEHPELKYEKLDTNLKAWESIVLTEQNLRGKWNNNLAGVIQGLKSLKNIRLIKGALEHSSCLALSDYFEPGGAKGNWLECTLGKEGDLLEKLNRLRYSASITFLQKCIPEIETVMRDKGVMTFFDCLYYLRNMLGKDAKEDGKLIRYIYDRHSYFLIDEFQDTNPMQAEVFFYLSSESPVEKWSACVPRPGSLFIVGDPKQSIYRFRSADVTSFFNVKKLFEENGDEALYLSKNFRSTRQLCSYFNTVFQEMLPEQTAVQSKFAEIPLPECERDEFQGVYICSNSANTDQKDTSSSDETGSERIKKIITNIVGNENYKITIGDEEPRTLKYSDFMIITYGKSKIDDIMKVLHEAEIPMHVEGRVPFGRNEALMQIFKIYSAVASPNDKKALYDALKGTCFGTADEEIMKYKLLEGKLSLKSPFELPENADPCTCKIYKYIEKLKALGKRATKLSPSALFQEIMDGYEVYRTVPVENMEVLFYTLELLRNAEKTGVIVSINDGVAYLSKLISGVSGEERCLRLNDSLDCVHIANLHKVKGLEAPVVILAETDRFSGTVTSKIEHGDSGSEGYLFSLKSDWIENSQYTYFQTDDYKEEKESEKEANNAERQRLLYVAATRARNALFICVKKKESVWTPLMKTAQSFDLMSAEDVTKLEEKITKEVNVDSLYDKARDECILNDRKSEKITYQYENPSTTRVASKLSENQEKVLVDEEVLENELSDVEKSKKAEMHRFPALLGTMTHRLMEILVSTKNSVSVDEAVAEIIHEYQTQETAEYNSIFITALTDVANKIQNGGYTQSNNLPQDILTTLLEADEVYCEVPFCYKEDTLGEVVLWNGIMDVIYCSDSKWHIIDYKTNADGSNLDQKYAAQLQAYVKAFKETTGEEADAFTYHIDI